MKIGVNTLFLIPGEVGGSETYLREILRELACSFPSTQVLLLTNRENDIPFRNLFRSYPQFSFCSLPCTATNRYQRIILEQTLLPRYVARTDIDLLWSPGYTAPFFSYFPQVVTIHDMQYKRYPEDLTLLARLATDMLVRMAVHRCQKIIAVSEFSRQEIIRFTRASSDKVTVIPEAADQMYAERLSEAEIRKRLAPLIPPDRPYLLCVANTYPHKNVHTLIQAFGDILDRIPHDLILVGKPRLGEPLVQKAIEQLPQKGRFHRIDRVENDQLIALYQGAELFVFPSLYEGFGLPVLEAMMAGTPVVASQNGSIPEVGGECITYFDEKRRDDLPNKIQDLLHLSKNGRDHLIQKAYLHATSFSWKLTVQKTLACFQSLI